jgi:hypothetical protein
MRSDRTGRWRALPAAIALLAPAAAPADDLDWLDAYNVVWTSPSRNAAESMPCGGGDIGMNVWVEQGDILCYVQRSGCFDENNEYLKLGRLRLRLEPNPFADGAPFRQELRLRDGLVVIAGGPDDRKTEIRVWVETGRSVVHVEIESAVPLQAACAYESWRLADESLPNEGGKKARFGCFSWDMYPGEVIRRRDEVRHAGDAVLFHHRNRDDGLLFDDLVRQQGLGDVKDRLVNTQKGRTFGGILQGDGFVADGTSEGRYVLTPFRAWRLRSATDAKRHHVRLVTHLAQTDSLRAWQDALEAQASATDPSLEAARRVAQAWWTGFWRRSRIVITEPRDSVPTRQAARNYQLFRYQLGCNVRGEYPSKFNGGNLVFDPSLVDRKYPFTPDWRAWGGGSFTAQNQRLLHWPMLKAGDADLMLPQFEFYRRVLANAEARVQAYWGHGGCCFTEQTENLGLPIAAGWGWTEPGATARQRGREVPFGDPRADGAQGYNAVVEHGVQANGAVSYHWEAQLEFSHMMLEHHRFFGADIRPFLPFIRQSVRFFDEHYQARERLRSGRPLDADGRLVLYPSTSCESYRGARNPADLIAGLSACLEGLLTLDDALVPEEEKAYFRGFAQRLPAYTYAVVAGDRVFQPAASWKRYQNVECPQFYPLFPFDRFVLGRDDLAVFRNTWKHGAFPKNMVQSWHQDGIFFARMGMAKEAADYNAKKLADSPRRFPTFWGPGHDWVPDHNWGGSGMIGLQEMLMQTPGRRILLLPAWPRAWECEFRLHAPHQTVVEGKVSGGRVVDLKVTPDERRKDVEILEAQ